MTVSDKVADSVSKTGGNQIGGVAQKNCGFVAGFGVPICALCGKGKVSRGSRREELDL